MARRRYRCTFCPTELELEADDGRWLAPVNWLWVNERLICDQHRRIVVNRGQAKGRVVRFAPLPAERV